jgi:hypothetical protein
MPSINLEAVDKMQPGETIAEDGIRVHCYAGRANSRWWHVVCLRYYINGAKKLSSKTPSSTRVMVYVRKARNLLKKDR